MDEERIQRKLTAIFSADAVGYSRLMRDDEVATINTLSEYRVLMANLIVQHKGRVIDTPGDNLLSEFWSVVDAVQSAVAIQRELKARNAKLPENRKMLFRIGINIGDVIQEDGRIYGDGVNIAARLEGLAEPGGICISRTAYDQIESKLPFGYEYLGKRTVKNINKPVYAYRVVLEAEEDPVKTHMEEEAGPDEGRAQSEEPGQQDEATEQTIDFVKNRIRDFAREIAGDEQIGKDIKEIKNRVRSFTDEMTGDSTRRDRAIRQILQNKLTRLFLGVGAILVVINVVTSFGRWWFQYPLMSFALVIYINWVRVYFLSSEKTQETREKIFKTELAELPEGGQATEKQKELVERRAKARIYFYIHLYSFLGVNVFLLLLNLLTSPFSWWFQFPLLGWGILIVLHRMGNNFLLPKE
jgi:class 3 adenylate cyclase